MLSHPILPSYVMRLPFQRRATEATTVIVSMGNDLYVDEKMVDIADENPGDIEEKATAIANGLKCVLASVSNGHIVYGGAGKIWGYSNVSYDQGVRKVCALLECYDGVRELQGIRTADTIGHLRTECVPQLCAAVLRWCQTALRMETPMARL